MTMRPHAFFTQTIALLLTAVLSLPGHAVALRNETPAEVPDVLAGLEQALTGRSATKLEGTLNKLAGVAGFDRGVLAGLGAGLEEVEERTPGDGVPANDEPFQIQRVVNLLEERYSLNTATALQLALFLNGHFRFPVASRRVMTASSGSDSPLDQGRANFLLLQAWLAAQMRLSFQASSTLAGAGLGGINEQTAVNMVPLQDNDDPTRVRDEEIGILEVLQIVGEGLRLGGLVRIEPVETQLAEFIDQARDFSESGDEERLARLMQKETPVHRLAAFSLFAAPGPYRLTDAALVKYAQLLIWYQDSQRLSAAVIPPVLSEEALASALAQTLAAVSEPVPDALLQAARSVDRSRKQQQLAAEGNLAAVGAQLAGQIIRAAIPNVPVSNEIRFTNLSGRFNQIAGNLAQVMKLDDPAYPLWQIQQMAPYFAGGLEEKVPVEDQFNKQGFTGHRGAVTSLAFNAAPKSKTLVSASDDGTVRIWSWETRGGHGKLIQQAGVLKVAFSSTGSAVLSVNSTSAVRHDWFHAYPIGRIEFRSSLFPETPPYPGSTAFSPDRKFLLVGGLRKEALIQNLAPEAAADYAGREGIVKRFKPEEGLPLSVAYSPDGNIALIGTSRGTVELRDVSDRFSEEATRFRVLRGHAGGVTVVLFSPDGSLVVSGDSKGFVRVWNRAGLFVNEFQHKAGKEILALAFNPDGNLLATGGRDGVLNLWDVYAGEARGTVKGPHSILSLAFSPNGGKLAVGRATNVISMLDIPPAGLEETLYEEMVRSTKDVVSLQLRDQFEQRLFFRADNPVVVPLELLARWGMGLRIVNRGNPGTFVRLSVPSLERGWEVLVEEVSSENGQVLGRETSLRDGPGHFASFNDIVIRRLADRDAVEISRWPYSNPEVYVEKFPAAAGELAAYFVRWLTLEERGPLNARARAVEGLARLDYGENRALRNQIINLFGELMTRQNPSGRTADDVWGEPSVSVREAAVRGLELLADDMDSIGVALPLLEFTEQNDLPLVGQRAGALIGRLEARRERLRSGTAGEAIRAEIAGRTGVRVRPSLRDQAEAETVQMLGAVAANIRFAPQENFAAFGGEQDEFQNSRTPTPLEQSGQPLFQEIMETVEDSVIRADAPNTMEFLNGNEQSVVPLFMDPTRGIRLGRSDMVRPESWNRSQPAQVVDEGGFIIAKPQRRFMEGHLVAVLESGRWNRPALAELIRVLPPAQEWSPFYHNIAMAPDVQVFARVRFRVTGEGHLQIATEQAAPARLEQILPIVAGLITGLTGGLEEPWVRVLTLEELGRRGVELAAAAQAEGYTQAILVPAKTVPAQLRPGSVDLYAHLSVVSGAMAILPEGWPIGRTLAVSEQNTDEANALLEEATDDFADGKQVVIALNPDFGQGVRLPENHPVALFLSPSTYHLIDRAALAAFLARPDALVNLILDLTRGTIERVTIEGEDYFAIFA